MAIKCKDVRKVSHAREFEGVLIVDELDGDKLKIVQFNDEGEMVAEFVLAERLEDFLNLNVKIKISEPDQKEELEFEPDYVILD